jgi:mannose-1-phosphate guanylyltransferase
MELFAVVLAGGVGTRFWPLSRRKNPKQFLPIVSDKTMIEETVLRLSPLIPPGNIVTISGAEHAGTIKNLLPSLPEQNILIEPQAKNTAPSLLLATASIYLHNPKTVVAALPADHLITDPSQFLKKIAAGAEAASQEGSLVTFGVPPTFPATGYGYIQFSTEGILEVQDELFYAVQEFKEKPDKVQAQDFLEAGNCYWNSGMFLWQAETFAQKLEEYAPELFAFWIEILQALGANDSDRIIRIFEDLPAISIDYALMEKACGVRMCEGNFGWSDVGSWTSLGEIWKKDEQGNSCRGESIILETRGCQVYNPDRLTALIGIEDIIVVNTDDALLICHRDHDQKVKEIVEGLKKRGKAEYL